MDAVASLQRFYEAITPALYAFGIGALILETLFFMATKRPRDKRSRWLGIQCGALAFGAEGLLQAFVLLAAQTFLWEHRLFDLGLGATAFVVALLLHDLMFYVSHRLQHEVRVLWAVHVVHHSARHYDLTTGVRGSALGALSSFPFFVWIPLVGVHPLVFVIVSTLFKLYGLAYHTELVGKLGWLEKLLVTPSNHRVHHATNVRYLDRNYGGLFILFDRLLGTYEPEAEPCAYGLTKDWHGYGVVDCQVHEIRDLARDVRAAPTWRAKLGYLLRPPGWRHDGTGKTAAELRRQALGAGQGPGDDDTGSTSGPALNVASTSAGVSATP